MMETILWCLLSGIVGAIGGAWFAVRRCGLKYQLVVMDSSPEYVFFDDERPVDYEKKLDS